METTKYTQRQQLVEIISAQLDTLRAQRHHFYYNLWLGKCPDVQKATLRELRSYIWELTMFLRRQAK